MDSDRPDNYDARDSHIPGEVLIDDGPQPQHSGTRQPIDADTLEGSPAIRVRIEGSGGGRNRGLDEVEGSGEMELDDEDEVWLRVGDRRWRLDSGDKHKNYSILTDLITNFTGKAVYLKIINRASRCEGI